MYRGVLGVSSSVGGVACCLFVVVVVVGEKDILRWDLRPSLLIFNWRGRIRTGIMKGSWVGVGQTSGG